MGGLALATDDLAEDCFLLSRSAARPSSEGDGGARSVCCCIVFFQEGFGLVQVEADEADGAYHFLGELLFAPES